MLTLRKADERGHFDHGWLNTYHTFSFSDYRDPRHMGFRHLRVINEDWVAEAEGFDTHPHSDMEIITYVLEGALAHKDSLGTGSVILPGDVQRMSAGTGIEHSEFNHSKTEKVHLLQIWIFPEKKGIEPSYEQKSFSAAEKQGRLRLVASRDGRDGSVRIHQNANLYVSLLQEGEKIAYSNPSSRHAWLQVARGILRCNDLELQAGDGLAVSGDEKLELVGAGPNKAELLLFDLS